MPRDSLLKSLMKIFYITISILITLFFTGCSSKNIEDLVYKEKSCTVLNYEEKKIIQEISKLTPTEEKPNKYLEHSVTTLGGLISLAPALFGSTYFYVVPGFTILYYNTGIDHDKKEEHREVLQKRLEKLQMIKEEKRCKKIL